MALHVGCFNGELASPHLMLPSLFPLSCTEGGWGPRAPVEAMGRSGAGEGGALWMWLWKEVRVSMWVWGLDLERRQGAGVSRKWIQGPGQEWGGRGAGCRQGSSRRGLRTRPG